MIRIIVYEIETLMPHGEPIVRHRTFDVQALELETFLNERVASVIGAEVVQANSQPAKKSEGRGLQLQLQKIKRDLRGTLK